MKTEIDNGKVPQVEVRGLDMGYGSFVLMHDLDFTIYKGDVFVIMGGSGCGKSTLLRILVGLKEPMKGEVFYGDINYWKVDPDVRDSISKRFGILYQSGALWSSMTLAENVAMPLEQYTSLSGPEIRELVSLKLALVGLAGFDDYYPSEISGGMKKRAGLARAMALDPDILFLDEPSAGLDPISARLLDDLILQLRESLGCTFVVVTHELPSIFAIGTNSIYLDVDARTATAKGDPKRLLAESSDPKIISFLTRGEGRHAGQGRVAGGRGDAGGNHETDREKRDER